MVVKLIKLGNSYIVYKDNDKLKTYYRGAAETEQEFDTRVIKEYDEYVKELKDFKEKTEPRVIKSTEI